MNKSELVEAVRSSAGVDRQEAERVLESFFDTVKNEAKSGGQVAWPGFGKFSTTKRAARTGRNPQTGAAVKIAASTAMKFSPASALKAFMNDRATGTAKKSAAKKSSSKKTAAKKAPAKKAPAKKTTAKKSPAKKATAKKR